MELRSFPLLITVAEPGVNLDPGLWTTPGQPSDVFQKTYVEGDTIAQDCLFGRRTSVSSVKGQDEHVEGPLFDTVLIGKTTEDEGPIDLSLQTADKRSVPMGTHASINHVAPDGKTVGSIGEGGLQLWSSADEHRDLALAERVSDFAFSSDGSRALLAVRPDESRSRLEWMNLTTGATQTVLDEPGLLIGQLAVSPDDQSIAYTSWDKAYPDLQRVCHRRLDGGPARTLFVPDSSTTAQAPAFTPDGTRVLFTTTSLPAEGAGGIWDGSLYAAAVDGSGCRHLLGGTAKSFVVSGYPLRPGK